MASKSVFIITAFKIYKNNIAASSRIMNIARAFTLSNNKVFLCSAELNKNVELRTKKEVEPNIYLIGDEPVNINKKKNVIQRVVERLVYPLTIFLYVKRISKIMQKTNGDKVIYLYPNVLVSIDIICLLVLKLNKNYKIYYDLNELRKASLFNTIYSEKIFKKIVQKYFIFLNLTKYNFNEKLLKYYDGIIAISTSLEKYCKEYNKRVLRIPILSNTKMSSLNFSLSYDKNEAFCICFTGQINLGKEGFGLLFEVIQEINKYHNTELHLFGPVSKSEKELILNIIPRELGILDKIKYYGIITQDNLLKEMQKRHLLILPRPLNLQTKYGFSTKLAEYLVSGIPTLVTDVSDNKLYINDNQNGFVVRAGNKNEMIKKILYIIENYNEIANEVAVNAYKTALLQFNYDQFSKKLDNFINIEYIRKNTSNIFANL